MSSYSTDIKKSLIHIMEINNDLFALDVRKNSYYRISKFDKTYWEYCQFLKFHVNFKVLS